jgi:hypothetical protein
LIGGAAENFHALVVFLVKRKKPPLAADEIAEGTLTTNEPEASGIWAQRRRTAREYGPGPVPGHSSGRLRERKPCGKTAG